VISTRQSVHIGIDEPMFTPPQMCRAVTRQPCEDIGGGGEDGRTDGSTGTGYFGTLRDAHSFTPRSGGDVLAGLADQCIHRGRGGAWGDIVITYDPSAASRKLIESMLDQNYVKRHTALDPRTRLDVVLY
jgi:hypothetical protein